MDAAAVRKREVEGSARARRPRRRVHTVARDGIAPEPVVLQRDRLSAGIHRHRHVAGGRAAEDIEDGQLDGGDAGQHRRPSRLEPRGHW